MESITDNVDDIAAALPTALPKCQMFPSTISLQCSSDALTADDTPDTFARKPAFVSQFVALFTQSVEVWGILFTETVGGCTGLVGGVSIRFC